MKNIKPFTSFINEEYQEKAVIDIDKKELKVNYQKEINGNTIEIEGKLIPYNSGRAKEYKFEPSYFTDSESEEYYDNNWENVEEEILNVFYGK